MPFMQFLKHTIAKAIKSLSYLLDSTGFRRFLKFDRHSDHPPTSPTQKLLIAVGGGSIFCLVIFSVFIFVLEEIQDYRYVLYSMTSLSLLIFLIYCWYTLSSNSWFRALFGRSPTDMTAVTRQTIKVLSRSKNWNPADGHLIEELAATYVDFLVRRQITSITLTLLGAVGAILTATLLVRQVEAVVDQTNATTQVAFYDNYWTMLTSRSADARATAFNQLAARAIEPGTPSFGILDLENARLQQVSTGNWNLSRLECSGCDLDNVTFFGSTSFFAGFSNAHMRCSVFVNMQIERFSMSDSLLEFNDDSTEYRNEISCDPFTDETFSGTQLGSSRFLETSFENIRLDASSGTNLGDVDFSFSAFTVGELSSVFAQPPGGGALVTELTDRPATFAGEGDEGAALWDSVDFSHVAFFGDVKFFGLDLSGVSFQAARIGGFNHLTQSPLDTAQRWGDGRLIFHDVDLTGVDFSDITFGGVDPRGRSFTGSIVLIGETTIDQATLDQIPEDRLEDYRG